MLKGTPINKGKYDIYPLESVTGVLYITSRSPKFISGHVRMRGTENGAYPQNYKNMIMEIFGDSDNAIEVCSGSVKKELNLYTVDINPETPCGLVGDAQKLNCRDDEFDRWYCDPPYNEKNAANMYNTKMPDISLLLKEGARVVKPDSLLFLLLGPVNRQFVPSSLMRIGLIFITVVPNNELRALHIYQKSL